VADRSIPALIHVKYAGRFGGGSSIPPAFDGTLAPRPGQQQGPENDPRRHDAET
jgi:hypothetical protein